MSLSESLSGEVPEYVGPSTETPVINTGDQLVNSLNGLFAVENIAEVRAGRTTGLMLRGKLLGDAADLYPSIAERCRLVGYTPTLQRDKQGDMLVAVPGIQVARRFSSPLWVHGLLFLLTVASTIIGGASFQNYSFASLLRELTVYHNFGALWTVFQAGAPFALTLLLILGTHEMGHYIAGRWHGVDVTLPYFIPMPLTFLGTLGAVIFIKSALTDRKTLFDVGISGPLAGFVVALVAFIIGIQMPASKVPNMAFYNMFGGYMFRGLGMPLLLQGIGALIKPGVNLGMQITLQPVALAAWFGMLLTVLNLMPLGQLDGGHVTYTLFGRFAWTIAAVAFVGLIFLGLTVFQSLLFYAFLVLLTGLRHPAPGNDITPLDTRRRILGYATIVLFFLIATPTPFLIKPLFK